MRTIPGLSRPEVISGFLCVMLSLCGCGGGESSRDVVDRSNATPSVDTPNGGTTDSDDAINPQSDEPRSFPKITLGGDVPGDSFDHKMDHKNHKRETDADAVTKQLDALQILVGNWRGVTNREFEGTKKVVPTQWAWDFLTDKKHPSLVMKTDDNPYFTEARLTYLTDADEYQMQLKDGDGEISTFKGEFTEPVSEIIGEDEKTHRTFKIAFTEEDMGDDNEQWQVTFNQQRNNRFLTELSKRRGSSPRFQRFDTIAAQREGTSFAINDSDYKDRTCVVSGGLGTIRVSHENQSYWVCCSGCVAAFNDDPLRWIEKFEQMKAEMK